MTTLKSSSRKRASSPPIDLGPKTQRPKLQTESVPRILIIGAGYRGHAYAEPIHASGEGATAAVIEASAFKRKSFGEKYIWGAAGRDGPVDGEEFADWEDYIKYERKRRERERNGEVLQDPGVDAAFVCVLDELHAPVVKSLAPLGLHIMCEKPLATRLDDIIGMYGTILKSWSELQCQSVFAAGYVLRYSPANLLLRRLARDERVIGDVISIEHTDTVGWWHFAHSYVRQVSQDPSSIDLLT
jgi:predicted dehydrogenase